MRQFDFQSAINRLKQTDLSETEQVEAVQDILTNLHQEVAAPLPDPGLLNNVTAAFRRKQKRLAKRPSRLANLQFDSWAQPMPLGIRGSALQERQLLFNEGDLDLDLQIVKDKETNTFIFRGQILSVNPAPIPQYLTGIELCLTEPSGNHNWRVTDDFGRFSFSYFLAGHYVLRVVLDEHDILLKSLFVRG